MNKDYPLLTVVIVALVCMMSVQIFGVYFNAVFPKAERVVTYECDFEMGGSILTRQCTIRGEWND